MNDFEFHGGTRSSYCWKLSRVKVFWLWNRGCLLEQVLCSYGLVAGNMECRLGKLTSFFKFREVEVSPEF